ncbi:deoxyribose-phosphate aldolase [Tenacibaculum sp.]|nr:deoxyribose-phosphate aldolase [Tenacibaculum sp.]
MELNKYIDHTLLKAIAQKSAIKELCKEAKKYSFYAVCINGCYVPLAKQELENSDIKIAAVIGFPLGATSTEVKVFEAKQCIKNGASEIDMVINVGKLLDEDYEYVEKEIREIKEAIGNNVLKVIFENCYLSKNAIKIATELAIKAKADYIKTSTGFGTGGANFEDVKLMKEEAKERIQIKAAGGIKDREMAEKYIAIGVTRLGTSSGVSLLTKGTSNKNEY